MKEKGPDTKRREGRLGMDKLKHKGSKEREDRVIAERIENTKHIKNMQRRSRTPSAWEED